jgi:TonB family protein
MAKPLHSANPHPQDLQFSHFGVLDTGNSNKASLVTSIGINTVLLVIALIISAAAVKVAAEKRAVELTYVVPVAVKPPEPPKPRLVPPKPIPPPPEVKVAEPKIILPKVTPPTPPKPIPVSMPTPPKPIAMPAAPKIAVAAAAPKPVDIHLGQSASVANHDLHPAAVSLGSANNPIAPSNRPATASVNLGQSGLAGMPPGSGRGPNATAVNLGSGQPGGSLGGNSARAVQGVKLGVSGGTPGANGNANFTRPTQVALGQAPPPPAAQPVAAARVPARSGPQVLYKPKPQYTPEAIQAKIEGLVAVRIRVSSSGAVSVIGVTSGLGHGLDESAIRAVQATRFKPAVDATGNPVDWEGVVNVSFQMAS